MPRMSPPYHRAIVNFAAPAPDDAAKIAEGMALVGQLVTDSLRARAEPLLTAAERAEAEREMAGLRLAVGMLIAEREL